MIVHASLRSVGPVTGGADVLLDALLAALGTEGTLLMPAFSRPTPDGVFDVRATPSRTGALSERFRARARRSHHPTHSVCAFGKRVDWLVGHERCAALGIDSPLHRAADAGARVLMIGCRMTSCSVIHIAEALARVPYLGKVWYPGYDRPLIIIREDGSRLEWSPIDPPTCSDAFGAVESELDRRGLIQRAKIGDAPSLLIRASDIIDVTTQLLCRDMSSLLCSSPACAVCPAARKMIRPRTR